MEVWIQLEILAHPFYPRYMGQTAVQVSRLISLVGKLWNVMKCLHQFMALGPAVIVIGANHSVPDAQWACSVDGHGIDSSNPGPFGIAKNNLLFCHSDSLTDGPHTLTVDAALVENQTFWFDQLEYVPSSTVSLENKMILLRREDSALLFGSAWNSYATRVTGARFTLNFYGTYNSFYFVSCS